MGLGFASCWFFLHLLLLLSGHEAVRLMPTENKPSLDDCTDAHAVAEKVTKTIDMEHRTGEEAVAKTTTFFFLEDVKVGKRMPMYFQTNNPDRSPKFLPKDLADSIPFTLEKLPELLQYFSIPPDTPQAQSMQDSLGKCNFKAVEGETKTCARSLESVIEFSRKILGTDELQIITSNHYTKHLAPFLQNYTVMGVEELDIPKMVTCHTMAYPYAVLYCHSDHVNQNWIFKVSMEGELNADKRDILVICHKDTSGWTPHHQSFQVLKVKPGTVPVCHLLPDEHMMWIPKKPQP